MVYEFSLGPSAIEEGDPGRRRVDHYLKPQWRWIGALQNDFAARADWCVKDFNETNHAPVVKVDGALTRRAKPGETVQLSAVASDPEGDRLTTEYRHYHEADSATSTVTITNSESLDKASFVVPAEPRKQVHIVLEVTDSGTPPLVKYQRVVFNIDGD